MYLAFTRAPGESQVTVGDSDPCCCVYVTFSAVINLFVNCLLILQKRSGPCFVSESGGKTVSLFFWLKTLLNPEHKANGPLICLRSNHYRQQEKGHRVPC